MSRNRYDLLVSRADSDPRAHNLVKELDRYFQELENQTKAKVQQCLNDLTHVISQPDAISVENTVTAEKIVKIGLAWGKHIDPQFGENSQIVNG